MYTLLEQLKKLPIQRGRVNHVYVLHDPGCPAAKSGRMADCRCQPDVVMADSASAIVREKPRA